MESVALVYQRGFNDGYNGSVTVEEEMLSRHYANVSLSREIRAYWLGVLRGIRAASN